MGFLKRTIQRGVSDAVSKAIGGAVKDAVTPVAEKYANQAAQRIDETAAAASQSANVAAEQTRQAAADTRSAAGGNGFSNLEGALGNLQRSMESYATEAAKNMKTCPSCGESTTADRKFCPSCGQKLPEQTVAQGSVCTSCGKQNTIGTKFCSDCGQKLPSAVAEEQAAAAKNAAVLAEWDMKLPQYPKWELGGDELSIESGDGYTRFSVTFATAYAAQRAVEQYREVLLQNGFREAGQYPSKDHLYKKINGVCYDADTEHCFEGDRETADFYFVIDEPAGGFDYVKPQPQKKTSLFDFFK